jgi:hypothetical protein
VKENVKTFVGAQEGQTETIVKVHEFLRTSGEWRVDLSIATINTLPQLGIAHRSQEFSYFLLLVDGSSSNFQAVNLL